jgi:hypothetical protein
MFQWLKQWTQKSRALGDSSRLVLDEQVLYWAASRGLQHKVSVDGQSHTFDGEYAGCLCRIDIGPSQREFIRGFEIRGRLTLSARQDELLVVMNRYLRTELEEKAFQLHTDAMQTSIHPAMLEEMRWASLLKETARRQWPPGFVDGYSVLTERPELASQWLTEHFFEAWGRWDPAIYQDPSASAPTDAKGQSSPVVWSIAHGKCQMRALWQTHDKVHRFEQFLNMLSVTRKG